MEILSLLVEGVKGCSWHYNLLFQQYCVDQLPGLYVPLHEAFQFHDSHQNEYLMNSVVRNLNLAYIVLGEIAFTNSQKNESSNINENQGYWTIHKTLISTSSSDGKPTVVIVIWGSDAEEGKEFFCKSCFPWYNRHELEILIWLLASW